MSDDRDSEQPKEAEVIDIMNPKVKKKKTAPADTGKIKKIDFYLTLVHIMQHKLHSEQWTKYPVRFHRMVDQRGISQYLEEGPEQVLHYVDPQRLVDTAMDYFLRDCPHVQRTDVKPQDFSNIVKMWTANVLPLDEEIIQPVRQKSTPGYTFHRLPFDMAPGPQPLFTELLSRMSNHEALKAWIGSLFFQQADRHQYVWIYGDGRNGKSALARFLAKILGPSATWETVPGRENQFWTSGLVGKRLVIFGDCNNYGFPTTGLFKSLTGGDAIRIERKNEKCFSTQLSAKFLFLSNDPPSLSSQEADLRRAIYIKVGVIDEDFGTDYEKKLWAEAPAILQSCIEAYLTTVKDHGTIPVDRGGLDATLSVEEEHCEIVWGKHFMAVSEPEKPLRERSFVTANKLWEVCREEGIRDRHHLGRFRKWMERQQGVVHDHIRLHGVLTRCYFGLRLKSSSEKERDEAVYAPGARG